jgi:hypothetical protein
LFYGKLKGKINMITVKEKIAERINQLPEHKLCEVLDFIEFLSWKISSEKEEPLLVIAGTLSGDPISAEDIERELYDSK